VYSARQEVSGVARQRTIEQRDRDAQAVDLRRRHLNYRQIAAQMGWASPNAAYKAVQRGLGDTQAEANSEVRRIELERLDDIARGFQRVFATKHYVVSAQTGKVARDPDTGSPLIDDGPVVTSGLALLRLQDRRAKYLGLDAPVHAKIEVSDAVDAEIERLAARLAGLEPRGEAAPASGADRSGGGSRAGRGTAGVARPGKAEATPA
jgi:hypothetical protein